jgi:hypothetical protein
MQYPLVNKQLCSLRRYSSVLSFRATETIITGTQSQDNFWEIWSYSCNILDETTLLLARSYILFGFRAKETIFTGTQTQDSFRG